ncbi:MAG: UbiA-like polyprenyltransferase [Bacteroidota bacterium]|nr:UbiA-like polyprenyltransferase [Bacteroidota bacterium]MDP3147268.1 UbiA-like polyprenyltransferase [Bacteroidota bacterium]MDP3557358.1 UbiA-like polyprenyltransferase [Bacteroidota bacterium]
MLSSIKTYFSLIKFSHTIFALPFAIIGFSLAISNQNYSFNLQKFLLVIACMVFARSAAMAFNRYIDRKFDGQNPRTIVREIPSGKISPTAALLFVIICCFGFVASAFLINKLCFYLSPIALIVVLGYSFTKRFTPLCHLILGLGLALAPIGAYLALTERFDVLPLLFSAIVFFWVSGFDIIYALQDDEFDKSQNLKSIPVYLGRKNALVLSRIFHFTTFLLVVTAFFYGNFYWPFIVGALAFSSLLFYQHTLVKPNDLSKVTLAFGTTNGIASVVFCVFVCSDIFLRIT